MHKKNAKVGYIKFDKERVETISIGLDYGGSCQTYGGYRVYSEHHKQDYTGVFLWNLFDFFEITDLSEIVGKPVVAVLSSDDWDATVVSLESFLGDKTFDFYKLVKEWQATKEQGE